MNTDRIIDKLKKLLRHQESAAKIGSQAEAEAFAERIQELLTTHSLEMSDIEYEEQEHAEPIDEEHVSAKDLGIKYERKRIEWQEDLAMAIAHNNHCRTLVTNYNNTAFFVGRKSDRELCVTLFRYFLRLIIEMSEKAALEAKDAERQELQRKHGSYYTGADLRWRMRDFRRSYCAGFSSAIQSRLYEQRRNLEQQVAPESTALVHLRNTKEAINAYLHDKFKDRKESKAKDNIDDNTNHYGAYRKGEQAGRAVALTSGALRGGE